MLSCHRQYGFTLIEAMIVIALIAFLLLLGLPGFATMMSNLRVRSVSDSVLSGVQSARTEALKRNISMTFELDPNTGIGGGWRVYPTGNIADVINSKSASEGGSIQVALDTGDTQIIFGNLGQRTFPDATTPVLSVDITNPSVDACEAASGTVRCLRVAISIGGESRLCDPKRPLGDPQACAAP